MDKLDIKISGLTLSTRTYNAVTRGVCNHYRCGYEYINDVTIRDIISLDYVNIRSFRNLGKKGFSELLQEIHLLGLRFDFEIDNKFENGLVPKSYEECLYIQQKYLIKIKAQEEKIKLMNQELDLLKYQKSLVDKEILSLNQESDEKKLLNSNK